MPDVRAARPVLLPILLALLAAVPPAGAKVVFTGYADFRVTPESTVGFVLPPGLAPGLAVGSSRIETRTATLDSLGLFAATSLNENSEFLFDATYRDIGYATRTIRLQYAYYRRSIGEHLVVRAGKLTLPFGYVNERRFYSFQQPSVTAPVFLSGILGLPIADLGVSAEQALPAGPVSVRVAGFAVNGYGPVPGSRTSFRSLALPGGLTIANNLGTTDANKKPAGGGRVRILHEGAPDAEVGGSFYAGHWDAAGRRLLRMTNGHAYAAWGPVDALAEYLNLLVGDDAGFAASLGGPNWRTDGGFVMLRARELTLGDRALTPWARVEDYRSRSAGHPARESMRGYAGGVAWDVEPGVTVKAEANQLRYAVPYPSAGLIKLDIVSYVLGLAVSF